MDLGNTGAKTDPEPVKWLNRLSTRREVSRIRTVNPAQIQQEKTCARGQPQGRGRDPALSEISHPSWRDVLKLTNRALAQREVRRRVNVLLASQPRWHRSRSSSGTRSTRKCCADARRCHSDRDRLESSSNDHPQARGLSIARAESFRWSFGAPGWWLDASSAERAGAGRRVTKKLQQQPCLFAGCRVGSETSRTSPAVSLSFATRATSAWETIPQQRPSSSTTGMRRT